ncbi:MAG: ABC transporter permease [Bacteroidota bacterium]
MIRLLQIEFFKLKRNKAAKVLSILYFALFALIAILATIRFQFGAMDFQFAEQGIFNFPYIWHFNTYFIAILKILLAIVIVSMMSSEYSNRTLKQNLIDGLSKKEFILSKFSMVIAYSLVSTLLVFGISLIYGLIYSDYTEMSIVFSELEYILAYFIKLLAFFSLCMFLGVLVKKSAFAIGFLFLLSIFESILKGIMSFKLDNADQIAQFFPLESMANLIKEPLSRMNIISEAAKQMDPEFVKDYGVHWYQLLIASVWCLIFVWASLKILQRRDL